MRPDGGRGPLAAGVIAPEVVGIDGLGHEVRLSAQRGHPSVVYFYPRDGTPGCTKEACAIRDNWARFEKAHVTVIGVSSDSAERHAAFLRERKLPFALAADGSGEVASAYGVTKKLWGFDRVTFLIDGSGRIARYFGNVDPGVHAEQILDAIGTE